MHRFDVKLVLLIYFILLDELVGVMVLRSLDVQLLMQRLMLRPLLLSPSLILWRFLVLDLLNVVLLLLFFHRIYLEILVRLRKRHVNLMSLLVWILLYILLIHISIEYLVLAWCWNELLVVWRQLRICHSVWRIVVSSSWVWNYRWGSFAVELILGHAVLAHHLIVQIKLPRSR